MEHAAEAIGCKPEHIVKTMSFLQDGKPALICMAGGSLNSTVTLSLAELEQYANAAGWVDVCKDWLVNE